MSRILEGKVVLITGAASGIGAATARAFGAHGAIVTLADIQDSLGNALATEIPRALFTHCDVTVEGDIATAVDLACDRYGKLDCLVNNAGVVGPVGSIEHTTEEEWNSTIAVLLRSVFFGAKHATRVMRPRRNGTILSVASVAGLMGGLGPHVYTAAKHGVIGLTKSLASELAHDNIRVNAVAPGPVPTPLVAGASGQDIETVREQLSKSSPLGSAIEPSEIAEALLYLTSEAARHVTGHTVVIDSGMINSPPNERFHQAR